MYPHPLSGPTLAVHPTSSGFGWVLFDSTGVLVDWGIASAKQGRKLRLVNRFKRLLARHEPVAVVFETYDKARAPRIQKLYRAFERAAGGVGAASYVYDRARVASMLGRPLHAGRYEIASAVLELLPELSHRMPRERAFGACEDPRESLFTAAALALTHLAVFGVPPPRVQPGAPE
jgi:hypothetical protein